jgi:hypothetical protein
VVTNTSIGTYGRTEPAPTPRIIEHDGVLVVRDDLFPGGAKARFLGTLFNGVDEGVYAKLAVPNSLDIVSLHEPNTRSKSAPWAQGILGMHTKSFSIRTGIGCVFEQ